MEFAIGLAMYVAVGAALGLMVNIAVKGPEGVKFGAASIFAATALLLICGGSSLPFSSGTILLCAALAQGLYAFGARSMFRVWRDQVERAPELRLWALQNFDRIDVAGSGQITFNDIVAVLQRGGLSSYDRRLLGYLSADLDDIGHPIATLYSSAPMSGATAAVTIYAATREELESYPARIIGRFESEGWDAQEARELEALYSGQEQQDQAIVDQMAVFQRIDQFHVELAELKNLWEQQSADLPAQRKAELWGPVDQVLTVAALMLACENDDEAIRCFEDAVKRARAALAQIAANE